MWVYWTLLGCRDKVVLVQYYYFPFCLHAMGTSWFFSEKVVRKVDSEVLEWNKAASVY